MSEATSTNAEAPEIPEEILRIIGADRTAKALFLSGVGSYNRFYCEDVALLSFYWGFFSNASYVLGEMFPNVPPIGEWSGFPNNRWSGWMTDVAFDNPDYGIEDEPQDPTESPSVVTDDKASTAEGAEHD